MASSFKNRIAAPLYVHAVYDAEGNILSDLTKTDATINGSTTVELQLTTGNTYSVIFWAAAPDAPYTVDLGAKTMTVDYAVDKTLSNDEARDAFYKYYTFTVTGAQTETIELRRPFAQINIGTADYTASTSAGYTPTHSAVTVKNAYSTLDLAEGKVYDEVEVTYATANIKKDETFPVTGYEYLAMNYVLVGAEKGVVDVEFTYTTSFNYSLFPTNSYNKEFKFMLMHILNGNSLLDRISYHDDTTPLVVKLGNTNLKGSEHTIASVNFYRRGGKKLLQYRLNAVFTYSHRDVAQSVSYNPNTGVYTYKPINVKGNYTATGTFDISRALDEKRYWTWQMNAKANYNHSIDHTMFEGETESHENEVNTLTMSDNTYIQYQKGDLNIRATGDIAWRHSEGRMRDFKTLNALDYQYGLSARYTLPNIKTTLTADGTMYCRRGYGSSMLNTDDFVVNASVSQPFLNGKLIARLEAFDLLHNLSATQYEVNAQGRTETWYRSLPHYAMLHLVYHWNKNPKKR